MILGKDSIVRSFHNVCRHRAFPVARKQSGTATVLGCRYHGWSYDTTGRLTKAPFFEDVPGFDKSQNSLYEIHTKEDSRGFLHINFSTGDGVEKSNPPAATTTGKLARVRPQAQLLHTLELRGKFNWKLLRECPMPWLFLLSSEYHSLTAHVVDKSPRLSSVGVPPKGIIGAFSARSSTSVGELSYYPLTTVHSTSNRPFWYQLTYNPMSAEQTALRCDVYSVKCTGDVELGDEMIDALKRELNLKIQALEGEHKVLAASAMIPSRKSLSCA
jgi:nitrite reductase/ring-hydroxylating ferredoxin subunit